MGSKSNNDNLNDWIAQENEELCSVQLELVACVKRELKNFRKEPQSRRTIPVYTRRLTNLNEYRTEFRKTHTQIIRNNLARTDAYFTEDKFSSFDEAYLTAFSEIQSALDKLKPRPTNTNNNNNNNNNDTERAAPSEWECNLPSLVINRSGHPSTMRSHRPFTTTLVYLTRRSFNIYAVSSVANQNCSFVISSPVMRRTTKRGNYCLTIIMTLAKCSSIKCAFFPRNQQ